MIDGVSSAPTIIYVQADGTSQRVRTRVGTSIMEAALRANVPGIEAKCRGNCACVTCHVYIDRNRNPPVGYKVVFVPFRNGVPAGDPIDFVSGFLGRDGKARGRPVGVTVDPRGALLVADDLSNTVWRIASRR